MLNYIPITFKFFIILLQEISVIRTYTYIQNIHKTKPFPMTPRENKIV